MYESAYTRVRDQFVNESAPDIKGVLARAYDDAYAMGWNDGHAEGREGSEPARIPIDGEGRCECFSAAKRHAANGSSRLLLSTNLRPGETVNAVLGWVSGGGNPNAIDVVKMADGNLMCASFE